MRGVLGRVCVHGRPVGLVEHGRSAGREETRMAVPERRRGLGAAEYWGTMRRILWEGMKVRELWSIVVRRVESVRHVYSIRGKEVFEWGRGMVIVQKVEAAQHGAFVGGCA